MKKAWGLYLLKCLFRSNTKWKYQCYYQPKLPPRWNISPIDGVYCFCPTKYQCLPICYVIVGDFNFFRTVCKMRQKYYGQFINFGHMLINESNRKRKKVTKIWVSYLSGNPKLWLWFCYNYFKYILQLKLFT